jgi:hypothetical protein
MNASIGNYLKNVRDNGFETVLELPFYAHSTHSIEAFLILWHSKYNILLRCDTHQGRLNSAEIYYNILRKKGNKTLLKYTYGGHALKENPQDSTEFIWIGHNDARDGVAEHIKNLRSRGKFLNPWREQDLWLLHYEDTKHKPINYDKINLERIAMLPKYVKTAITPIPSES